MNDVPFDEDNVGWASFSAFKTIAMCVTPVPETILSAIKVKERVLNFDLIRQGRTK